MHQPLFFPADAHEGPVWVPAQNRLYYATNVHPDGRCRVDLEYLDFNAYLQDDNTLADVPEEAQRVIQPQTWVEDANFINGMRAANDGEHLLAAEQGDEDRAAGIALYHLQTAGRAVVVDAFGEQPFNSPNKVIETRAGHLIFSDPDYGFRQGFRPPPVLEPMLFLLPKDAGEVTSFRCQLEMPHGLALTPDERTLFVSDTSNDGVHGDDIELNRQKSVWRFGFDPDGPAISGPGKCCFAVDEGVPDGMLTTEDRLLVGGGDGVYVADLAGKLLGKITLSETAVNLTLAEGDRHLFVTVDKGVLLVRDWREMMGKRIEIKVEQAMASLVD